MRRFRRGFTLIEVSLFLAITGLLFLGVTIGVQNSMTRQRYNDTVQSFAEFLRNAYSEVTNVQGVNNGRSDEAIYGKLITFGEQGKGDEIFVYDVVGRVESNLSDGEILRMLDDLGAKVVDEEDSKPKGIVESFVPKWGAKIQTTASSFTSFKGLVLIARHPNSGTVYTYFKRVTGTINMEYLKELKFNSGFSSEQVDLCVNPDNGGRDRADVRIKAAANSSAEVEVFFDEGNKCER